MNKKLIAIAVASVMATPVMAADLKISGRINQQFTSKTTDATASSTDVLDYSDDGHQRLQFDVKAGNAFGRYALDLREGRLGSTGSAERDKFIGYKFGANSIQFGRMANAGKNIEKDPFIATFLGVRSTAASATGSSTLNAYDSNGFISDIAQFSTKVSGVAIKVQLGLSDNDAATGPGATNQGHVGISATGTAGGVRWFISQNNGTADQGDVAAVAAAAAVPAVPGDAGKAAVAASAAVTNDDSITKVGASMKFGKVKTSLAFKSAEDNGAEHEVIVLRANMGFGNGLTGYFGYATATSKASAAATDVDSTWLRLAVAKKLNKSTTFYGGYTATDVDVAGATDTSEIGVGLTIKF